MTTDCVPRQTKWPSQIKFIVGNEAAERFSYYGMKSILALYITNALMQSEDRATTIIHLFGFGVYFMPLFGAWLSDQYWGRYRTIFIISIAYCAGHATLACSDLFSTPTAKIQCLYLGLGLIALGAGGIKPCVSAFMGDQFGPTQSILMRRAYAAFYFAINWGSFFSFLIIPWIATAPTNPVANRGAGAELLTKLKSAGFSGYGWAFGVPGIVMALATLIFWLGRKHYVVKLPQREATAGFFRVYSFVLQSISNQLGHLSLQGSLSLLKTIALPMLAMICMVLAALGDAANPFVRFAGWTALAFMALWYGLVLHASFSGNLAENLGFWNRAKQKFSNDDIEAARSVAPILAVFAFIPAFWALFEQSNSTWVLQGSKMQPFTIAGMWIGAEQMQSLNPLLVMILIPILTWGVYPLVESFGIKATPLRRIAIGLVLAAFSYALVAWLQRRIETGQILSLSWQVIPYLILTIAEVLVSTTGLEFAYTQAAPSMKSTVMSFWLLTIAFGNLLVTTITQLGGGHGSASVSTQRFLTYAALAAVVSVLFIIVAARYRDRDWTQSNGDPAEQAA